MTLQPPDIEHTILGPTPSDEPLPTIEVLIDAGCRICTRHYLRFSADDWGSAMSPLNRSTVCNFPYADMDTHELRAELMNLSRKNHINEIDVVVNRPYEIQVVADAVGFGATVKIIIEPQRFDEDFRHRFYEQAEEYGVDYLKTFTGKLYTPTHEEHVEYVEEMSEYLPVKAAGNIRTVEEARELHQAGAERIGSSVGLQIANNL